MSVCYICGNLGHSFTGCINRLLPQYRTMKSEDFVQGVTLWGHFTLSPEWNSGRLSMIFQNNLGRSSPADQSKSTSSTRSNSESSADSSDGPLSEGSSINQGPELKVATVIDAPVTNSACLKKRKLLKDMNVQLPRGVLLEGGTSRVRNYNEACPIQRVANGNDQPEACPIQRVADGNDQPDQNNNQPFIFID